MGCGLLFGGRGELIRTAGRVVVREINLSD